MFSRLASRRFSTQGPHVTHKVFNQGIPLINFNLYQSDPVLQHWIQNNLTNKSYIPTFEQYGQKLGTEENIQRCLLAEKNIPTLRQFDTYGNRIDVVDFHPTYHEIMKQGLENGTASFGFAHQAEKESHIARSILYYLETQSEAGHCCPITMTFAAIPTLLPDPNSKILVEKLTTPGYDPRNVPISEKIAITSGMSMTEKQGGSDVRANTTFAKPINQKGQGAGYLLTGHKWFTSAPMCDIFLTLAMTEGHDTPSCFIVPRWLPDGTRNTGFRVMRLKNKLGDRANASSEVEYDNAYGTMVGGEGKGVKTIMNMVQSTRLDCVIGSSGYGRRALQHSLVHATKRQAFGKVLNKQPLMQNVLADLCLEAQANTLTSLHLSSIFDQAVRERYSSNKEGTPNDDLFRIAVTVAKYWITKRLPQFTYECMEALGGNGYVEDFPLAVMYRQAPLNAIWEGSGNVIALDVLRAFKSIPILLAEIQKAKGQNETFDQFVSELIAHIKHLSSSGNPLGSDVQRHGRELADKLALALQASIMIRFSDNKSANTYVASRLSKDRALNYGASLIDSSLAEHLIHANTPKVK